jgi:hypothetical protein
MQLDDGLSLLLKRKAVSGVTLSVSNFALRQNTELPTNATNKSTKRFVALSSPPNHLFFISQAPFLLSILHVKGEIPQKWLIENLG